MSSEQLADGVNPLDAELAATWDILKGYSGRDTDLGIARRFGSAAAAYSLRDIGAMNGRVVKVRRDVDGDGTDKEEDFSANQVQDGTLERWVNGELESTLPADVATAAAAYSLRKVKASYSGNAVRIRRSSDDIEVDVAFDSDGKVSASSAIANIAEQGGESGQTTDTTLGDFINGTDAFVHTWYDQAGSNDAVQETAANQPQIAENGALLADGLLFDGSNDSFEATDITNVNFPATIVSVSETNDTGSPNKALYSLNNDSNACCGFYRSTNKYAINNGTTTLAGSETYTTGVHRLKFDLFNGASSAGFSNSVSDISGDIGTQVSQVTHFRIAGSLKTGITNPHNGTIKEIILYTSDQSDNRFKIESNINNYYGLYTFQGDGFVETWYDQSGNGNDVTQGTAANQPAIVQNGSLNTDGIDFDGSNDELRTSTNIASSQPVTVMSVTKPDAVNKRIFESITNSVRAFYGGGSNTGMNAGNTLLGTTNEVSINTEYLQTHLFNTTNSKVFLNSVETISGDAGSNAFAGNFSLGGSSAVFDGTMKEVIIYLLDKTSDRSDIENDINNHYNIF